MNATTRITARSGFATILAAVLVGALTSLPADKKVDLTKIPPAAAGKYEFAKDIKPIFEKSCIKCHGPEKQKGKLRLDSLAAVLKGGQDGKVILPGDNAGRML